MALDTTTEIDALNGRAASTSDGMNPAGDISGGVEIPIGNVSSFTLYLSAAGAVSITVEASPNGTDWFVLPESPVEFAEAGDDAIQINYDMTHIKLTGTSATDVQALLREVV